MSYARLDYVTTTSTTTVQTTGAAALALAFGVGVGLGLVAGHQLTRRLAAGSAPRLRAARRRALPGRRRAR